MSDEHAADLEFTRRLQLEKAIKTLIGIVEGIAVDGKITVEETSYLSQWVKAHKRVRNRHPFNELMPVIIDALEDEVVTEEERMDIMWLCEKLSRDGSFYDKATVDMQRLHGILGGILADGVVTERELRGLSAWLDAHDHLRKCWPYDEVNAIVSAVMADGQIDSDEQIALQKFFGEFVDKVGEGSGDANARADEEGTLAGVYAVSPQITVADSLFCFTGTSHDHTQSELVQMVLRRGGRSTDTVSGDLDYLIVGAGGNPCWTYTCYGRKIEAAVKLREQGHPILLVREQDFHRAVRELGDS